MDKHQSFLQVDGMCLRASQTTQNNKLAISLQGLNKKGRDQVDFLHADKHQTFLLVDTVNFGGQDHSCPKHLK